MNRPLNIKIHNRNGDKIIISEGIIRRKLKKYDNLRRVFIEICKKEPCIISEILEDLGDVGRSGAYRSISVLLRLGVIDRIQVFDVMKKENPNYIEKEIRKKFLDWTSRMPEKTKQYYLAKTRYQFVTEYGEKFVPWCCDIEKIGYEENRKLFSFFHKKQRGNGFVPVRDKENYL